MRTHTHKGVTTKFGKLKSHPVARMHRDKRVQAWHNIALGKKIVGKAKNDFVSKGKKIAKDMSKYILCPVDKDGYIFVDLTRFTNQKGVRVKFIRKEGRTKKTVGLQIER